jgi:hypothetical protein
LVAELKADEFACPEHVQQAETHVAQLLCGIQKLMTHSFQAREKASAPPTRLVGKGPPRNHSVEEPASTPSTARYSWKQPPKRTVLDFFRAQVSSAKRIVRASRRKKSASRAENFTEQKTLQSRKVCQTQNQSRAEQSRAGNFENHEINLNSEPGQSRAKLDPLRVFFCVVL